MAYQYYLHVVPTTYVAPRTAPLHTNQYSVTHYTRKLNDHEGTPGIFFKFDLDPMVITIYQRTTSLVQLLIRYVQAAFPTTGTQQFHQVCWCHRWCLHLRLVFPPCHGPYHRSGHWRRLDPRNRRR
jgi:hypothetical protein